MSKLITLTQGRFATVDDQDFDAVNAHRWQAIRVKKKGVDRWYARRSEGSLLIYMHHFVIGRPPEGLVTDHIDGDGLNNGRLNLRHATYSVNSLNRSSGSSLRCVYRQQGKFIVRIRSNSTTYYGGLFESSHQAACAANALMRLHHGEHARLNNVEAANEA